MHSSGNLATRHVFTLVGLLTLVVLGLTLALWQWRVGTPPESTAPAAVSGEPAMDSVRTGPATKALAVLHAWDSKRSAAYRRSDPEALRRLYARGSKTGERDVKTLQAYAARGLRVHGMDMQVLELDVKSRMRNRLEVVVVDRLVGAYVSRGQTSQPLPVDRATTRRITMVRQPGKTWRVREVI